MYLNRYSDTLILSNRICADSFLYDFEYFSNYFISNNKESSQNSDISFLLSKIKLDVFLKKLRDSLTIIEESFKKYETSNRFWIECKTNSYVNCYELVSNFVYL